MDTAEWVKKSSKAKSWLSHNCSGEISDAINLVITIGGNPNNTSEMRRDHWDAVKNCC